MRSLLPTELMEEIGRLAVTDVDSSGNRLVRFWIDEVPNIPVKREVPLEEEPVRTRNPQPYSAVPPFPLLPERNGERAPLTPERRERPAFSRSGYEGGAGLGSPSFGAGVSFSPDAANPQGLTPEMEPLRMPQNGRPPLTPSIHQKTMFLRDVHCCLWNHCASGFVKVQR